MKQRYTVVAISGSTRENSTNHYLIGHLQKLLTDSLDIVPSSSIASLPHFNPDLDREPAPDAIAAFRKALRAADGIFICTPEYAMGVPGSLKNALDWTVSSMEFSQKPVALITASSVGQKGHAALLETLKVIEAVVPTETQLIIPFVKTKVNEHGFTDEKTKAAAEQVMLALLTLMEAQANI